MSQSRKKTEPPCAICERPITNQNADCCFNPQEHCYNWKFRYHRYSHNDLWYIVRCDDDKVVLRIDALSGVHIAYMELPPDSFHFDPKDSRSVITKLNTLLAFQ